METQSPNREDVYYNSVTLFIPTEPTNKIPSLQHVTLSQFKQSVVSDEYHKTAAQITSQTAAQTAAQAASHAAAQPAMQAATHLSAPPVMQLTASIDATQPQTSTNAQESATQPRGSADTK